MPPRPAQPLVPAQHGGQRFEGGPVVGGPAIGPRTSAARSTATVRPWRRRPRGRRPDDGRRRSPGRNPSDPRPAARTPASRTPPPPPSRLVLARGPGAGPSAHVPRRVRGVRRGRVSRRRADGASGTETPVSRGVTNHCRVPARGTAAGPAATVRPPGPGTRVSAAIRPDRTRDARPPSVKMPPPDPATSLRVRLPCSRCGPPPSRRGCGGPARRDAADRRVADSP